MTAFFRLCRRAHAETAWDGEGARRSPGRWNHKGVAVVYCASSLSLAALECFVHLDPEDLPDDLVSIEVDVPKGVTLERLDPARLPREWRAVPAPAALKDTGSDWVRSGRTVGLLVPSAVVPAEDNLLLNPRHEDMRRLVPSAPEPFAFDPRMRRYA